LECLHTTEPTIIDKKNDTYIYLVDEALGIAPYDRVSTAVAADMVEYSSDNSYAKSSLHATGGIVSRQTVMNKTRKVNEEKLKIETERSKAKSTSSPHRCR
jgi:hypothetical protein